MIFREIRKQWVLWTFKRRLTKHFHRIAAKFPVEKRPEVMEQLKAIAIAVVREEYKWGVYDTETFTWIGDDKGPALYDHDKKQMAMLVCSVAETMKYGTDKGKKFEVRVFVDYGEVRMVGTEKTPITRTEALKRLEEGRV